MTHISRENQPQRRNADDKLTMATASNPNIYINTTQYRISFCTRFHYNLLKPCAKGNTIYLPNHQEMGSRHIAVQAFLSVCDDAIMLDRWIPDEDWVRQIRESGGDGPCSMITNLNTGLAKHCSRQNNHAILHGRTVFHNKKHIRTSKTKASITNQFDYTMLWEPISQLQPSHATKVSINRFGMTSIGAPAPSSKQPRHKPIKPPLREEYNHQPRRPRHHQLQ
jgi:hypothetical protein